MISRALLVASFATLAAAEEITAIHLAAAPAVSPDGKSMVFEWSGDLWSASTEGGEAIPVVESPAFETRPLFTTDGKRVVFSSDRTGAMQVFSIPAGGGEILQHTRHSEGSLLECLSPDGSHAVVRGNRERSGRLLVVSLVNDVREQRLFDAEAHSASWSPDGTRILFCTGGNPHFRKGYQGSRASQIWQYDMPSGKFECRVAEETESMAPAWHADGRGFHFISARSGTLNLWSKRDDAADFQPLTRFSDDSVLGHSTGGSTVMIQHGFELSRFRPGIDEAPVPLKLWTRAKVRDISRKRQTITETTDVDFAPQLDQVIFSAAGELWWMKSREDKPRRLTETAAAEGDVHFLANGEWLYFLRDDGLEANYFRVRFRGGMPGEEQQVTRGSRSKSHFQPAPGGGHIAWIEGTGDLFTAGSDGTDAKCVFKCWDTPTFDWSPTGDWLAVAAEDRNANRDIWLVTAGGKRAPLNLTRHPAFEGFPRWSPDGRRLVFSACRNESEVARLWQIDFGKDGISANATDARILQRADKATVISTGEINPVRAIWGEDSASVLFQNQNDTDPNLYSVAIATQDVKVVTKQRGLPIRVAGDGSLLWRVSKAPAILKGSELTVFPISASIERPREDVLRLAFRRIWRTVGERFYDAKMNGTHWETLRNKYENAAVAARDSKQFERVVSQLLGELNASHLIFRADLWPDEMRDSRHSGPTAHPGLVFRDGGNEGPLVIERVLAGSPVAMLPDPPQPGEIIVKIAGEEVTNRTPLHRFFSEAVGRVLPVVLGSQDGRERVIELRCISYAEARSLDRKAPALPKDARISYLPVPDMSLETFEKMELEIYRNSMESDGLILDLRNNTGGREADRMLSLFCQPLHSFTVPRDGPKGYPVARRVHAAWDGALVVLCNEDTVSNAEIFCHAIRKAKRAPLVGSTTAGCVLSSDKVVIPDAGELEVPFRGWFEAGTGANLDRRGATPDFPMPLTPADEAAGRDPQLEKAVEALLNQLRNGQ